VTRRPLIEPDITSSRTRPRGIESAAPPILFLHIRNTGGASFLSTLQNLFGEHRVRRINPEDPTARQQIAAIAAAGSAAVDCVAGELPVHLVRDHLRRFRPFTLLRNPVSRVFSIYRSLQRATPDVQARYGLEPEFSFESFITSRHPALFAQINNGMCRMLCSDAQMCNGDTALFWQLDRQLPVLHKSVTALQTIDYGLLEAMPATRAWLQARWGIPFPLDTLADNPTPPDGSEDDIRAVQRVVEMNLLDIALYERAATKFYARATMPDGETSRRAIFRPLPNLETPVAEIAGRQGFHPIEPDGVAWLRAERPARIHFLPPAATARLRLSVLCATPDYPVAETTLTLNGRAIHARVHRDRDPLWCTLETERVDLVSDINELAIDPPCFLAARRLNPGTPDQRYLAIGLHTLTFIA
jgi:hypothetical protein